MQCAPSEDFFNDRCQGGFDLTPLLRELLKKPFEGESGASARFRVLAVIPANEGFSTAP